MKKLLGLFFVISAISALNVCAMERGEGAAPVILSDRELSRELNRQRKARQDAAKQQRMQQRNAGQYRGIQQNLNHQLDREVPEQGEGVIVHDMDIDF